MKLPRGTVLWLGAALLANSALVFAQVTLDSPAQPLLTRAEVRQQFIDLRDVGYRIEASNWFYPDDIQQAQQRLACKRALQNTGTTEAERSRRCNINIDP